MSAQESFSSNNIYGYLNDIGDEGLILANNIIGRRNKSIIPFYMASCSTYILSHLSSKIYNFKEVYVNLKHTPFKHHTNSLQRSKFSKDALY